MTRLTPEDIARHAAQRLTIVSMRAHGATRDPIAQESGITPGGVAKCIQRMIRRGLITRGLPGPKRGPRKALTDGKRAHFNVVFSDARADSNSPSAGMLLSGVPARAGEYDIIPATAFGAALAGIPTNFERLEASSPSITRMEGSAPPLKSPPLFLELAAAHGGRSPSAPGAIGAGLDDVFPLTNSGRSRGVACAAGLSLSENSKSARVIMDKR